MAVCVDWCAQSCGGEGRGGLADDICCQLARQSSKGTFTNSWLWHCHPQLTGVESRARARARWLNPNSARGMNKSHQQWDPYYCLLYLWSCLRAFSLCNQTTNDAGIFLPPCQTELTETSWGFEGSQRLPQLLFRKRPCQVLQHHWHVAL